MRAGKDAGAYRRREASTGVVAEMLRKLYERRLGAVSARSRLEGVWDLLGAGSGL